MATQSCGNCKYFYKKQANAKGGECSIYKSLKYVGFPKCINYEKQLPTAQAVFNPQITLL